LAFHAGSSVADEFPLSKVPGEKSSAPSHQGPDQKSPPRSAQADSELTRCEPDRIKDTFNEPSIMADSGNIHAPSRKEDEDCAGGGSGAPLTLDPSVSSSSLQAPPTGTGESSTSQPLVVANVGNQGVADQPLQATPPQVPETSTGSILPFFPQIPSIQSPSSPQNAACFLRDTRILTPAGERKIQDLRIDDLVTTPLGSKPIKWIPRQIIRRSISDKWSAGAAPIVIQENAIAQGLPNRNLSVSPLHMLCIDGAFVEAKDLVNGTTVLRMQPEGDLLEYFNIEVQGHTIIYANGIPAETYNPNSVLDRENFVNFSQYSSRYAGEEYVSYPPLMRRRSRTPYPISRDLILALLSGSGTLLGSGALRD
jgi:hypothetical protein